MKGRKNGSTEGRKTKRHIRVDRRKRRTEGCMEVSVEGKIGGRKETRKNGENGRKEGRKA